MREGALSLSYKVITSLIRKYLVCDSFMILNRTYKDINQGGSTISQTEYVYVPPHPLSPRFTGQEEYLEKLRDYFGPHTSETWQKQRRCFLLYGIGGVGKTQIALKFAEESADR